ncbi:MAG: addiction module toxin, HicA family [Acidobacteriia bacterium]|nr:addiction module toxin, HicA family [Terriglobia bacterium]MYG03921.1 addiction module toxin, HicA family [Terriglobia bacterium]MYK09889.1 addiction module toxin, HicA family [Terriglobia bacterium]
MPKVRDAIRRIRQDGWSLVRTKGSHRQYRHSDKPGTVTIAGKLGDDLTKGTWSSIMKQAGVK